MPIPHNDSPRVPVSKRALIQRINRALAKNDERLCKTRGDRWRVELGDFYTLDVGLNGIAAKHVDLEELGRELGVLRPYESLRSERGAPIDAPPSTIENAAEGGGE